MRIVITDTAHIWNHANAELEKYKDNVLVVCLNGKKVTDKYECFVSPYKQVGMGTDSFGTETMHYKALKSVAGELNNRLYWWDSVLFLTDNNPESLYPFHVVKDLNEYNDLHLCTMAPFRFEARRRITTHKQLLSDLSKLKSVLYFNPAEYLSKIDKENHNKITMWSVYDAYSSYLPTVINNIESINKVSCFDFGTNSYIPVTEGYAAAGKNIAALDSEVKVPLSVAPQGTLGIIVKEQYPKNDKRTREEVEWQPPRTDGKKICEYLRQLRIQIARANNIKYYPARCSFSGPCAGTCKKCEEESAYLRDAINRITPEKRIIPDCELSKWEV